MKEELISIGEDRGMGRNPAGQIVAANEDRFDASHFSEPLTAYAVGYPDSQNLQALLDDLFAPVATPRRFEFKQASASEAYVAELDDIRAIGDKGFARVEFSGTSTSSKTYNKGLTVVLDKDEMVAGDEERKTGMLINRLRRNDLRRGITLLLAAATNTNKTWNTSSDPDMDVLADLITGNTARGIPANKVVFGQTAWMKRQLAFRANDKAGSFASAQMLEAQLSALLGVEKVSVCRELYKAAKGGSNTQFLASYVVMLFNQMDADREDASTAKRFYTPTESGPFRVYRQEYVKTIEISVEHYSNLVVTNSTGLRTFTIA